MTSAPANENRLFFCLGPGKSGTTFLRHLLDSHPRVSCLPEQDFVELARRYYELMEDYNNRAATFDQRTGGEGRKPFRRPVLDALLRLTIISALRDGAGGKPVVGAKDNGLLQKLDPLARLFPEARFVVIFRNPLDRAVSAWHHNLHIAEKEGASWQRERMMQHGDLDGWALQVARWFQAEVDLVRSVPSAPGRILYVRYEDLVLSPHQELLQLLEFIGADADPADVEAMIAESSLERMRAKASDPAFFRAGAVTGGPEISAAVRQEVARIAARALAFFGYRVELSGVSLHPWPMEEEPPLFLDQPLM